jgi:uncharacterized protein (TIGR04255 family)
MRIPRRLKRNPLLETIAEVRFTSAIPTDAVLGVVYAALKEQFGDPTALPISQMPLALREADPHMKYMPCYRFDRPGNVLLVGPHNVAVSTHPYIDWSTTSPVLKDVFSRLEKLKLFSTVDRCSLRYVNFFEKLNVLSQSNLVLTVLEESISDQNIMLRSEKMKDGFTIITTISNEAVVPNGNRTGSIIDIDISKSSPDIRDRPAVDAILEVMKQQHHWADKQFFRLLKEDFIKQFEPEY